MPRIPLRQHLDDESRFALPRVARSRSAAIARRTAHPQRCRATEATAPRLDELILVSMPAPADISRFSHSEKYNSWMGRNEWGEHPYNYGRVVAAVSGCSWGQVFRQVKARHANPVCRPFRNKRQSGRRDEIVAPVDAVGKHRRWRWSRGVPAAIPVSTPASPNDSESRTDAPWRAPSPRPNSIDWCPSLPGSAILLTPW